MFRPVFAGRAVWGILVVLAWGAMPAKAENRGFTAELEANPAVFPTSSKARGTATFRLSADGRTLHYRVEAFDVDHISQIHIHLGESASTPEGIHYHRPPEEGHGHTVAFLLNFRPAGMRGDGLVAQGDLTAADLSGPLRGQPFEFLIDHMKRGWAYVNVHIFQDFGSGRLYCCPTGIIGIIRPDG